MTAATWCQLPSLTVTVELWPAVPFNVAEMVPSEPTVMPPAWSFVAPATSPNLMIFIAAEFEVLKMAS